MSTAQKNLFEKKMARLEEIVRALEAGDVPLEEGMALYKEGAECSRLCRQQLDKARHELSLWQDGQESPFQLETVSGEEQEA